MPEKGESEMSELVKKGPHRNNIEKLRRAKGWPQTKLAMECGWSQSLITRIEAGWQTGTDEQRTVIVLALGSTMNEVFPDEDGTT